MKNLPFITFIFFLLFSCKKQGDISIYKIERDEEKNEINIIIKNNSLKKYYIFEPHCEVYDGEVKILYGIPKKTDYKNVPLIDSVVKKVYNFVDDSAGIEKPLKIFFIDSKDLKKLNFKFNENIKKYPITNIYFTFNIYHEKLLILDKELKNVKLKNEYEFYSKEIK